MHPALFDSSIYISALRRGDDSALAVRRIAADAPLWLSAVVLEELYAGANERAHRVLERLERDFDRAKRVLVPNLSDWTQAGQVLALLAAKYDYEHIGQGRLTGKYSAAKPPPGKRNFSAYPMEEIDPIVAELRRIGDAHGGKTPSQVALNWVICKGAGSSPRW